MPKGLCIFGMVIAALIFLLFTLDLILSLAISSSLAPFAGASWFLDIVFALCAAALGWLSWTTFKEQP